MKLDYLKINGILKNLNVRLEKSVNNLSHLMVPSKFSDNMKSLMDLYNDNRKSPQFLFFQKHLKASEEFMNSMPYNSRNSYQESDKTLYPFLEDMKQSGIDFHIVNFESLNLFVCFFSEIANNVTHKKIENEFTKAVGLKEVKNFFSDNIKAEEYFPKRIVFPKTMMMCLAETVEDKDVSDDMKEVFLKRMVGCVRSQSVFNPVLFSEPAIPFFMDFYKQKGLKENEIKMAVLDCAIHKVLTTPKEKAKIDTIIVNTFERWGYFPDTEPKVGMPDYINSTFTWNIKVSPELSTGRGLNGVGNDRLHSTVLRFLSIEAKKLGSNINETGGNFNFSVSFKDFDKFVETVPKFKSIIEDFDTVIIPFMVDKIKNKKMAPEDLAPLTVSFYETFSSKKNLDAVIASSINNDDGASTQSSTQFKL